MDLGPVDIVPRAHALDGKPWHALATIVSQQPERLGSASVGRPNGGWLLNGVQLTDGEYWTVVDDERSWGTAEAIAGIQKALSAVGRQHPGSPKLFVGDISRARGGYLSPHRSHQSGRDVDLGYYYVQGAAWYKRATAETLDVARTWSLVRALLAECDIEYIFMDRAVQTLLMDHALATGEDSDWVTSLFQSQRRAPGVIRHTWGHSTHMHVRFYSNLSMRAGALAQAGAARR